MRRRYAPAHQPQKPFITNYHICEVPLPYYNPLEDPHLRGYFSNRKVNRHINEMGMVYHPRKEYPYFERRSKNYHKHLKDNLCKVPNSHLLQHPNFQNRSYLMVQSQGHFIPNDKESNAYSMPRRKAGSEILNKTQSKWSQLNDIISNRNDEIVHNRRRNYSPDVRSKSHVFERRKMSAKKDRQNAEEINLIS